MLMLLSLCLIKVTACVCVCDVRNFSRSVFCVCVCEMVASVIDVNGLLMNGRVYI